MTKKIIYTFLHRATHSVLSHRKISECVCDITDKFTFINAFNLTRPYSNTRRQVKNQIEIYDMELFKSIVLSLAQEV